MTWPLLLLFTITFGLVGVIMAIVMADLLRCSWKKLPRLFRFSLSSFFGIVAAVGISLGVYRFQLQAESNLPMPFVVILVFCVGLFCAGVAIAREFGRRPQNTALHAFRKRQQDRMLQCGNVADNSASNGEAKRGKGRMKWWLRRKPNRFRSISHRDAQASEPSGYYIRDD